MYLPSYRVPFLKNGLKYLLRKLPVPIPKRVGKHWWLSHPLQFRWKTETHILDWVEQLLRQGDTIFDVGAHAGWISLASSQIVGSAGHVVAIEPSPALASLIRYHREINHVPSVHVEEFAVADSCGIADFFTCNRGISSINSLSESSVAREKPLESSIERISVRTRSLDDYCEATGLIPNLVKVDVEGAELLAIKGALSLLARHRPALILAVHPPLMLCGTEQELFNVLDRLEYVVRDSHTIVFGNDLWGDYLLTSS
jgi:FkbM family methyltransferase